MICLGVKLVSFRFRSRSRRTDILPVRSPRLLAQRLDQVQLPCVSLSDRHTLWRCLQSTVTPVLASMLEVMDRYANLDLLSDVRPGGGLVRLWVDILADSQILDLAPLPKPRYCGLFFCIAPTMKQQDISCCV